MGHSDVLSLGFILTGTNTAPVVEKTGPPIATVPPRFTPISELVAERESTEDGLAAMKLARIQLAAALKHEDVPSLRSYRLLKGLSQAQLAKQLSTVQPHIARIENAQVDVQISTLVRMAKALDITLTQATEAFLAKYAANRMAE
jgi:DNA-binding XRE family transcriptional regulator